MLALDSLPEASVSMKDAITLCLAIIGAVLGVLNLVLEYRRWRRNEQVRLEVLPTLAKGQGNFILTSSIDMPGLDCFLAVRVTNRSHFPIYLATIAIDKVAVPNRTMEVCDPDPDPPKPRPVKLERGEWTNFYLKPTIARELLEVGARGVIVETTTGEKFIGRSPALDKLHDYYLTLPKLEDGRVDWGMVQREHPTKN